MKVGLLGFGVVGRGFYDIVATRDDISVAKVVLSPKMPIKPHFIKIPLKPKKDFNKMLYANVINLTPGTLTIDITEDSYIIHALNEEFAEKIEAIEKQKELIKKSIAETEELFNSRMDYYFN